MASSPHTSKALQWLCRSAWRNVQWALEAGLPVLGVPGSCSGTASGTWQKSGWVHALKLAVKPRPSPTADLTLKLKRKVNGASSWHKDAKPACTAREHRQSSQTTISQGDAGDCAVPGPASEGAACDSAVQPGSSLKCKARLSIRPAACCGSLKYSHPLRSGKTRPPLLETFVELDPSSCSLPWHVQLRLPLSHQQELLLEHGSPSRGSWLVKACLKKTSVGHGFNCHLKYGASGDHWLRQLFTTKAQSVLTGGLHDAGWSANMTASWPGDSGQDTFQYKCGPPDTASSMKLDGHFGF